MVVRETRSVLRVSSNARIVELREISRKLFNQKHAFEVLAVVAASDGLVNLTSVAEAVGVRNNSSVQKPLESLVAAGLLADVDLGDDGRTRWLRRSDDGPWEWVLSVAAAHGYLPAVVAADTADGKRGEEPAADQRG